MLKFYGYKNCDSCRKAEKFLNQKNLAYEFIDITQCPPLAADLQQFIQHAGIDIKKYFNTSGEVYRALGLKDKIARMPQEDLITLLASNGRLIKRPLITDGKKVSLGFKENELQSWI